jgi:DNA polymerase III subunit alpha
VDSVMDLARARSRYAQALQVKMNGNADAAVLKRVLEAHRPPLHESVEPAAQPARAGRGDSGRPPRPAAVTANGLAVQIHYRNARAQGELRLGDGWRVRPTDDLLADLRGAFAESSVEIVY